MSYPAKPYRAITSIVAAVLCIACVSTDAFAYRAVAIHGGGVHRGGVYHGGVAWRGGVYRRGGVAWRGGPYRGAWVRPGVAVGVGAAAVGAAAFGAAAANPYNNLYNYYNSDYYNAIGGQCGYAPYPPCY
jgi:hypothetical protein